MDDALAPWKQPVGNREYRRRFRIRKKPKKVLASFYTHKMICSLDGTVWRREVHDSPPRRAHITLKLFEAARYYRRLARMQTEAEGLADM